MKNHNTIVIHGWMINELGLKGSELLTFALINGFSQDEESLYYGSYDYIAEAISGKRRSAINAINSLIERGLILKYKGAKNALSYRINIQKISFEWCKNCTVDSAKNALQGVQKMHSDSAKNAPNNNIYNNNININALLEKYFNKFYELYPNKKGKKKAEESYKKCFKNLEIEEEINKLAESILNGLKAAMKEWEIKKTEKQYIPHPTTWLNQERWNDEYESEEQLKKSNTSSNQNYSKHNYTEEELNSVFANLSEFEGQEWR